MTTTTFHILVFILVLIAPIITPATTQPKPDPYFSKNTFFKDYKNMQTNLKIFIYPNITINFPDTFPQPLSTFHTALVTSKYLTRDPSEAALFFLPFPPQSTRSLARYIQNIRTEFPYWNRSLGADHFYLTSQGIGPASSRNVVELVKNGVQVTCFPSSAREFVPHKDVTLPPYYPMRIATRAESGVVSATRFLAYLCSELDEVHSSEGLIEGLRNDVDFLIESEPLDDESIHLENMAKSKFCIFIYDDEEGMSRFGMALAQGCVPIVITDHPIQDFPLMDVIRWSEIVLFVGSNVGPNGIKHVLNRTWEDTSGYEMRRGLGVAAARHMIWNSEQESKPLDAFEMVVYQLWIRRHAIRYSMWEVGSEVI